MSSVEEWLETQSICVTGGRGSLGRRLVNELVRSGATRVVAFDTAPPTPSDGESGVQHFTGSILNLDDLRGALSGCTVVFHLAALVHVGRSQTEPFLYFEVNALGTASVLEACRLVGVPRVVYASTSHVYGKPRRLPIGEEHLTDPLSAYAASKLAGENAIQAYGAGPGLHCDIARLANLYGASDNPETVVGRALEQALQGEPIRLRNLGAVRDFVHAADVVETLMRLAADDGGPGCRVVNVSTGRGRSVREMADVLSGLASEEGLGRPQVVGTEEEHDELVLDNGQLAERTGWTPKISLEEGLRLAWRELAGQRVRL